MSGAPGSLLERIERDGAAADIGADPEPVAATPDELIALLRSAASALPDEAASLAAWDEAGVRHTPELLDAARSALTRFTFLSFLKAVPRRKLRDAARLALRTTRRAGSLRLAAAFVGELGDTPDVAALEAIARHPALTLHGATALANLIDWHGRLALLRLLVSTDGDQRVLVIDRLLPHAKQAAVRLALVRDAVPGLSEAHAADVAADIAAICRCKELADDPDVTADVRAGARAVIAAATRSASRSSS